MIPTIVVDLLKKAAGPLIVVALLALAAGAFYGMHQRVLTAEATAQTATTKQHDAEANAAVAASAAEVSAGAASAVQAADAAQMDILRKQKDNAVARAGALATQLTEIQNAPHTTTCIGSPAVSLALSGVRNSAAARRALRAADPVPHPASGPVAPDVQGRAGGAGAGG